MRRNLVLLTICSISLAWTSTASAQGACANDIAKFCKDVPPGEGRVARCLYENRDGVSDGCKRQADKMITRALQVHTDCVDDAQQFCSEVQPGQGRIAMCLNEHRDSLSEACRGHVKEVRQAVRGMQACAQDAERLCAGVDSGEGRLVSCLREHRDELSKRCAKLMERQDQGG